MTASPAITGPSPGAGAAPPRLGIVISMFPELHETFILRELVALERRGVDFDVYSLQHPRDPITIDDAIRLSSERTTYSKLVSGATLGAFARAALTRPVALARAVARLIVDGRDRPGELVKNLAVLPIALHFGELGRRRGVTHWHGHWANVPTTACWWLGRVHGASWSAAIHGEDIFTPNRFLATKLDAARFSVVCSGHFCRHLRERIGLDAPERVHLNYHGLDPRILERAGARGDAPGGEGSAPRRRAPGEPLRLLSIGRLVPTKGHDTLLRAVGRLARDGVDVTLEIVGSGPERDALGALAAAEGIEDRVRLRGALPFAEVVDALEAGDAFCLAPRMLPGHPPDGIPNVIAEAMALGLPVVATRVSAIPELVEHGVGGLLVEVDDDAALADAVRELASDPALGRRLAAAARARVAELFDRDRNIDELIGRFDEHVPGAAIGARVPRALSVQAGQGPSNTSA